MINFVPACSGKVMQFHKGDTPGRSVQICAKGRDKQKRYSEEQARQVQVHLSKYILWFQCSELVSCWKMALKQAN